MTVDEGETGAEVGPLGSMIGAQDSAPNSSYQIVSKEKVRLFVAESRGESEMDLDFPMKKESQEVLQAQAQKEAQRSQIHESPWRKHVGVCQEGVYFPPVL